MMLRRVYSPIGLDVTTRCIRALQLVRRRAGWRLHAAAALERTGVQLDAPWIAPSEAEYARLAGVLERQGFEGTDVVMAAPSDRVVASVIELPPRASGAPIAQLAAAELGRVHKVDPTSLQVAYWEVPSPVRSTATEYLVAGCTEQSALDLIDPPERAGLIVRALDVRALALRRACGPALGAPGAIDAILCMGWNHTTLLFVVDGVVTFQRALEGVDGRTLTTSAAQKLRITPEAVAALVLRHAECSLSSGTPARRQIEREIAACLSTHVENVAVQFNVSCAYISRRYPDRTLNTALVSGEFGTVPGVVERLERGSLKARRFGLADAVDLAGVRDGAIPDTEFIAPLGLAMRPMRDAA
jgi:Tfp pilus assembly PilM family ATPase